MEKSRQGLLWLEFVTGAGRAEGHRLGNSLLDVAGLHFLQEIWDWEIQEDNCTRVFRHFHCDGGPFLSYDLNTHGWTVPCSSTLTLIMEIKKPGM